MDKSKDIYIVGIGHNTAVTIELAELAGYEIKGLIHYNNDLIGDVKWGYPIIAQTEDFIENDISQLNFALSMGDNVIRKEVFNKIKTKGGNLPILIHPSAVVSRFSTIKEGSQIHANSTIQADVNIGVNTIISFGVGISHNCNILNNCYIACHSLVGAYTTIFDNVLIGVGCTSISGKVESIGENSQIGAGSLITKIIEKGSKIYGRPAK